MHALLTTHVSDNNIANIIIEYAQNGYRWYQIRYTLPSDDENYMEQTKLRNEDGIIYHLEYDVDDYFRDNAFYKPKQSKTCWHSVSFDEWRQELESKYMDCMSDEDLVEFVLAVDYAKLSGQWNDEYWEEWLLGLHRTRD